ncbi:MAG: hypothetical protein ACQSGP_20590 [Frankia sp.]
MKWPGKAATTGPHAAKGGHGKVGGEPMQRELVRATQLVGLPVLSITEGEAVGDIKDVLYVPERGGVVGFTLNRRRTLGGPMKEPLALTSVFAIGQDAVTIADATALEGGTAKLRSGARADAQRNVLANQVLTDTGAAIGRVADLIVAIGVVAADATETRSGGGTYDDGQVWHAGDVVGYELEPPAKGEQPRFLPLPDTLAVSGEILMVPAGIEPYIRDELSALAPAVAAFRSTLSRAVDPSGDATRPVATPPADPPPTDPASTDPASTGPTTTGPPPTGPATTGPATTGPPPTGPVTAGPPPTGPATPPPTTGAAPNHRTWPTEER